MDFRYAFVRRSKRKIDPPVCASASATIGISGCRAILPILADCKGMCVGDRGVEYGGRKRSTGIDEKARRR